MAKKGPRNVITLECTEARKEGKSPSRYTTTKNKKTTPERLELKKYNPDLPFFYSCQLSKLIISLSKYILHIRWQHNRGGRPLTIEQE